MRQESYTIKWNDSTRSFRRISRQKARKLYNSGTRIYLLPCNANLYNKWIQMMLYGVHKEDPGNVPFEQRVSIFEIMNCCTELGSYAKYFEEV